MMGNFDACYAFTVGEEGGYSDNPQDKGNWTGCAVGAGELKGTNKGISACTYPDLDIVNLTDLEIESIYQRDYWAKMCCDVWPAGVDLCTFDGGVNSGPAMGVTWLQEAVGAAPDGIVGDETRTKVAAADPNTTIDRMCDARLAWLKTLDDWPTFGEGWENRIDDLRAEAHAMASAPAPAPTPAPAGQVVTITLTVTAPPGVTVVVAPAAVQGPTPAAG